MATYRPTPDFKGRTFKLCVLTERDFNFCVRSSPLRGIIADTLVDVVEERSGTGEEDAGRSETLDEHGAVRAVRVLAHWSSGTLGRGAQTLGEY